ncbi:gamma-glutamyl-gamma-aminobutyrate hydrolase family protein [Thermorudis peleae]|uniref:gamma-glutamyl-gamma-aminobutyrate hydrolase family protein n=1 Tax=Thermorudis peleae TaxID=1382356 RepID=UPI00056DBDB4|nr:gamma-glutamyl-gamma-aminobutyrate hydrolase family protein [Thermorudis peleae]
MPLIGITVSLLAPEPPKQPYERYTLTAAYAHAIAAAGGEPILLPPLPTLATGSLLDHVDGILLSGGADIAPHRYGEETIHPTTYGIHSGRDELELQLVRAALARELPILGICRGCQVLNVAFGGTLYQDIPSMIASSLAHQQHEQGVPGDEPSHAVHLAEGSLLASIYGSTTVWVNSFHHQAVRQPGAGLIVSGRADDGIIEGLELPSAQFVIGVQWHPELMVEAHPEHRALFAAFVEAARTAQLARTISTPSSS